MSKSEKKSKILIVARDFPPYSHTLGAVVRVVKLAEFLLEQGYDVHVVSAKGEPISDFGYGDLIERVHLTAVTDLIRKWSNRKTNRSVSKPPAKTAQEPSNKISIASRIISLVSELSVPDLGIFFLWPRYRAAAKIISKHKIRNVFVTSPPHSNQIIGLLLKRRFGTSINLIVDYRDSWNCRKQFRKSSRILNRINERIEKSVLKSANHFVYVSPPMLEKVNDRYFDISDKSLLVLNGYDQSMAPNANDFSPNLPGDILTIGHFGPITPITNFFRDPQPLLRVIANHNLPIRLLLYGVVEIDPKWQEILGERLQIAGCVDHHSAIKEMQKMDALLFLHTQVEDSDEIISGKFFEYILSSRPIIVAGPRCMQIAKYVEEKKLGYHVDVLDEKKLVSGLIELLELWQSRNLPSYRWQDLPEYSRQYQYQKLLSALL